MTKETLDKAKSLERNIDNLNDAIANLENVNKNCAVVCIAIPVNDECFVEELKTFIKNQREKFEKELQNL